MGAWTFHHRGRFHHSSGEGRDSFDRGGIYRNDRRKLFVGGTKFGRRIHGNFGHSKLKVVFSPIQPIREHALLVQAENGSSVTVGGDESEITYFNETGTYSSFSPGRSEILVVQSGAVLEGIEAFSLSFVYVEAGGAIS